MERETTWASSIAPIASAMGSAVSAAAFNPRTITRLIAPKAPRRESFMISSARSRLTAPPRPSKVSASPSSWKPPVSSRPAPIAKPTAKAGVSSSAAAP